METRQKVLVGVAAATIVAGLVRRRSVLLRFCHSARPTKVEENDAKLERISSEVLATLRKNFPKQSPVDASLYQMPPFVPKTMWTELGDIVKVSERPEISCVPGDRWISLRLDGCGFSKLVKKFRAEGIFAKGFSPEFAEMMQVCTKRLMESMNARVGFTQSDEITVLIAPTSIIRGVREPHKYGGRVLKLCTVAAGEVTALFNYQVHKICAERGIELDSNKLPYFDCRLGTYSTAEEAQSLIWWRAYDCSVNGISDAVHHSDQPNRKKTATLGTTQKLGWLSENNMLPLPPHQAYGSLYVKAKRHGEGFNPKTGQTVKCVRGVIEQLPYEPVLHRVAGPGLLPVDDVEEP